jgi:hypothetical protein
MLKRSVQLDRRYVSSEILRFEQEEFLKLVAYDSESKQKTGELTMKITIVFWKLSALVLALFTLGIGLWAFAADPVAPIP